MTQQEILNSNQTKTAKIQQLLGLGLTRTQVAELMGCGYGMVQNIFARMYGTSRTNRRRTVAEVIEEAEYSLTDFFFNHTFGVELEGFGVTRTELETELKAAGINIQATNYTHTTTAYWKITTDGSLQGLNSFEIVSPKLQGEAGLRELKTVTLILKGLEAKINKTCGLHIHFDAAEFSIETWKNLYKNYAKIENVIDSWMPTSRRASNNTYCKSMRVNDYETKIDSVRNLANMEDSLREIERRITGRDRYYKLNSQSFWRQRSVEFRQHSGSIDFKKISNWILFLARLIEFSKMATFSNEQWGSLRRFLPNEIINYYEQRRQELAQ